ncbi:TIGR03564 family F420-dependent LLM class oxidoreductase [Frankia sp. R82]|uniref:TIGR03564 family F420-dependent LLM class oxidoreductase n=1 Tax=Frankia sp. R82 TaxID=2950553 RepID=UPI00204340F4|nr:TIGR03564 family F420-dependent LLM class oxidoreductase [Frankia sp. R82]MCM3884052.1 TIGR03564 family F420-dependent LLM class oxidoreductase [Frankia sp. R82]
MSIGISLPSRPSPGEPTDPLAAVVAQAREAAELGLDEVWLSQGLDLDAIAVATVLGREVPGVRIGTAAVPIYPRHPLVVAAAARTAQVASGGRFQLGVGMGNKAMIERIYGVPYDRPVRHLRDYLRILRSALATGGADLEGPTVTARLDTSSPGLARTAVAPVPLLVAAMGPQTLRAAGELADGTLPFLAGPRVLAELIVPAISSAARAAGRPAPVIGAGVPAVVTTDVVAARAQAQRVLAHYAAVPSYRAALDREGVAGPADLALIGDEETVAAGLQRYLDAGATDLRISPVAFRSADERIRTWRLAGELARRAHGEAGATVD